MTTPKKHNFVKLNSKTTKRVTIEQMLAERGPFSLSTYYDSYVQIEEKINCSEEGVKLEGNIDECLFIIYTNPDVGRNLQSNKFTDIGEEILLMKGGSVLQFNEEDHEATYQHLQKLPNHRDFLRRFRMFYGQDEEKEMDWHIKRELQQIMKLPESELGIAHVYFSDIMEDWWVNCR